MCVIAIAVCPAGTYSSFGASTCLSQLFLFVGLLDSIVSAAAALCFLQHARLDLIAASALLRTSLVPAAMQSMHDVNVNVYLCAACPTGYFCPAGSTPTNITGSAAAMAAAVAICD